MLIGCIHQPATRILQTAGVVCCLALHVDSATFQSAQSGPAEAPTTWVIISGTDADNLPDADDEVQIVAGHTVTLSLNLDAFSVRIFGTLTNTAPVRIDLYGGNLTVYSGGRLNLSGQVVGMIVVESVSITTGNTVTLTWVVPPAGLANIGTGDKILFLDQRPGDSQLSREANRFYDVVGVGPNSITYSLGPIANPMLGDKINNVLTSTAAAISPGDTWIAISADINANGDYTGKYLEFSSSANQYLIADTDALTEAVQLYNPVAASDAVPPASVVSIHNGVRSGDQFLAFTPVRVESVTRDNFIRIRPGTQTDILYAELSGFLQNTYEAAIYVDRIDNNQAGEHFQADYVDIANCNGTSNFGYMLLFRECQNIRMSYINVHDSLEQPTLTRGIGLLGCTDFTLEDSRLYRLNEDAFVDTVSVTANPAINGLRNTIRRSLIHDLLGGLSSDGTDADAAKQFLAEDVSAVNIIHNGFVGHNAENKSTVVDHAPVALFRSCVGVGILDNGFALNEPHGFPGQSIRLVNCIVSHCEDIGTSVVTEVAYSVLRYCDSIGDYYSTSLLGNICHDIGGDPLPTGFYAGIDFLLKSCLVYRAPAGSQMVYWASFSNGNRHDVEENTFVGQNDDSQNTMLYSINPLGGGDISRNIFYRNRRGIWFEITPPTQTHDYNLYYEQSFQDLTPGPPGPNSIQADPLFRNEPEDDYRLSSNSPALAISAGTKHAGLIRRTWIHDVLGIPVEIHRGGRYFNDLDSDGVSDFGNVALLGQTLWFDLGTTVTIADPNDEFTLTITHDGTGESVTAGIPVLPIVQCMPARVIGVTETTFAMLFQWIEESGALDLQLTHVPTATSASLATSVIGDPLQIQAYGTPTILADLDNDGDVDSNDFLTFSICFNGSLNPPNPGCANPCADLDGDGDIDPSDFLTFSNCFNGALNPPACP